MELAFGGRPSPKNTTVTAPRSAQVVGQAEADGDGQPPTDDGVAPVEPATGVEQVHRAAAAAAAALHATEHLGHDRSRWHAAGQGVAMLPVGGDDVVGRLAALASHRRRRPPHRCRGGGSRGSARRCRARRSAPRSGGSAASPGTGRRPCSAVHGAVHGPRGDHLRHRCVLQALLLLQGRQISLGQAELTGSEQAADDLAAAGLGQPIGELDLLRCDRRAQPLRPKPISSRARSSLGSNAWLQGHERLHHLPDHRVGLADHPGLGHRGVLHRARSRPRRDR